MSMIVVTKAALRPDPDEGSPAIAQLAIGDRVAPVRELATWTKGSVSAKDGKTYVGWLPTKALGRSKATAFVLFDEPDGTRTTVEGELGRTIVTLEPWRKVEITLANGDSTAGWILEAGDPAADGSTKEPDQPPSDQSSALSLGPNEIYRTALMLAQSRTGIDAAAIAALISAEAAKTPDGQWMKDSKASTSSATGLTQFLKATWLGEAARPRTLLNERAKAKGWVTAANAIVPGRENDILALRLDPELSIVAAAEYGISNLGALIKAGLVEADIGDDEKARFIYLAHHEGLGGAQAFLKGSIAYSFADVARQVGPSRAQTLVNEAGGDTTRAYHEWLNGYLDRNIRPEKFRGSAPSSSGEGNAGQGTTALSQYEGGAIPVTDLGSDVILAKAIQWRLTELGYLDPPADGKFGPVSTWALTEFCDRNGVSLDGGFTQAVAQRLLNPSKPLPEIVQTGTWFDKVVAHMVAKRYFISRHPDCKNIVYLEGVNPDGTLNDDAPDVFNDIRVVFSVSESGRIDLGNAIWEGTSEPGKAWTLKPMNPKGAARIAFNQYKAWVIGIHPASSPATGHQALVQVEPVTVHRDLNKDFKRTGDDLESGLFGINQHWGYDSPRNTIGKSSAGCLVGRTKEGHREFMGLLKRDPRYVVNRSYRFLTAILAGDEILR